ncbi:Beta,beta-carotene 15,15'-dioxygenase [Gracilariopsis chorda]|uniref:Beta,beta-carotene 15,15'-dioxygenase n=1 Tax=Gracilariopsis chorda TaxID=448386 RepID=A0A2V3IRQ3_9FLOR|nr:Beta,beta-carotene 15,15'-dioxygenase [Gracilariopsis chorda]|eukprot:PXF44795.1 Beta,beta-carotene 15,15'-dioxygenase [Gracilariopsis chorda]
MQSIATGRLAVGLRTVEEHPQFIPLKVNGTLPPYLSSSSLFRIGPGRFEATHSDGRPLKVRHWFDGLSILHHFQIDARQNQVSYRSRSLSDALLRAIEATPSSSFVQFTFGRSDPCRSALGKLFQLWTPSTVDPQHLTEAANINVTVQHIPGKGVCARTDSVSSLKIDENTLEIDHFFDLNNVAGTKGAHIAASHGHYDAHTGDFINYTFKFGPGNVHYTVFRIDRDGKSHQLASFRDKPMYLHSFATTEKYVILMLWPLEINSLAVLYNKSLMDGMKFHKDHPTKFVVISRERNEIHATYTYDAFFCFHTVNAFDVDNSVVIDLSYYRDATIIDEFEVDKMLNASCFSLSSLVRFTLDGIHEAAAAKSSPRARMHVINPEPFELMRINPDRQRLDYRYTYGVTNVNALFDAIAKVCVKTGERWLWKAENRIVGEPIFVPDPQGQSEEDGCLLVVVLDVEGKHSSMCVIDAKSMHMIADAAVPDVVPLGFHGMYKNIQ